MARDVFISYRSEDKEAADRLCAALERENISCWIAPRDIPIGQEWATAIVEGLQRAKSFVVVLSSNSKNARQISREAELADRQRLPIITFRIEDVQPPSGLLYFLGNVQWLDAFGDRFDSAVARVAEVVRQSDSYPAEKTAVHAAAPVQAAPEIQPSKAQEPDRKSFSTAEISTPGRSRNFMWIAAAGIAALALLLWLVFRPRRPQPPPAEARAVAERFVSERAARNYAAAWKETGPGFNGGVTEQDWLANAQKEMRVNSQSLLGCKPEPQGVNCEFALSYQSGRSAKDIVSVKPDDQGRWAVWRSRIQSQQ
ncbi:MAG: TIR domain-containing protein [Bryobacteraceae bacterium]